MKINGKFYGDDAKNRAISFLSAEYEKITGVPFQYARGGRLDGILTATPGVGWPAKDCGEPVSRYAMKDGHAMRDAWILLAKFRPAFRNASRKMFDAADSAIIAAAEDSTEKEKKDAAKKLRFAWRKFWASAFKVSGVIA